MPENRLHKYNNPPIKEAVFDLQIRSSSFFSENLFKKFLRQVEGYIPHGLIQNINIDTHTNTQASEIVGYRCISTDKKQIVQFKKYGFSFNRLQTYNGWEKNYREALKLWNVYCEIMNPTAITRVANRFINQFHIPNICTKPAEYFNTYIQYDNSISSIWNQMSYRILLSHSNGIQSNTMFDNNINQNNQSVNVVFDIDVFSEKLNLLQKDTSTLENIFNQLRKVKNEVFEKGITNKTRNLIK